MAKKMNPGDYLKPRDPATLVRRRGRTASTFYPDLIAAFIADQVGAALSGRETSS